MSYVIEVRSKPFDSRVCDKHDRAERIRERVGSVEAGVGQLGVWLMFLREVGRNTDRKK